MIFPVKKCKTCSSEFAPKYSSQKYCSRKCSRSEAGMLALSSPEVQLKRKKALEVVLSNPEEKERRRKVLRETLSNPEVEEKRKRVQASPEIREKMKKLQKEAWSNPDLRARQQESHRKVWLSRELRIKQSEIMKKISSNPEYIEAMRKIQLTPEVKAKVRNGAIEHDKLLDFFIGEKRANGGKVIFTNYSLGRNQSIPDVIIIEGDQAIGYDVKYSAKRPPKIQEEFCVPLNELEIKFE